MRAQLIDLYEYNRYFNRQFLELLQKHSTPEQCLTLLAHLINTHHIWLRRAQQQPVELLLWQSHELASLIELNETLHQETFTLLQNAPENLSQQYVFYQNNEGKSFVNKLSEILYHLINHSTHHRGQVAILLRQNDIVPPISDYIFYKREEHLRQKA